MSGNGPSDPTSTYRYSRTAPSAPGPRDRAAQRRRGPGHDPAPQVTWLPAGPTTYHNAPKALRPWPFCCPAWVLPSVRLIVPSSEALTPLPALGVPLLWSAGQAEAQAPLHADWFGWSFWNRYRVRPLPSTRIDPSVVLEVETVAGPLLVEGAPPPPYAPPPPPPPEFELLLPPPPQPAASAAAARATSATSGRRGNPVPPRSAFLMTTQTLTSTPPSESKSVPGSGTTTRLPQTRRAPSRSGQADSTQLVEFGGGRSCQCIWGLIGG